MKRFFLFLLSAAMVLSLLGCGEKDPSQADRVPSTSAYAQYVEPWVRDVPQIAMDTGTIQFYFMSGEGMKLTNAVNVEPTKSGDSCLICFPDGQTMLIDGNQRLYAPVLIENLERLGVKRIDHLVISHPHSDHYGGIFEANGVADTFEIGHAYWSGVGDGTRGTPFFIQSNLETRGIPTTQLCAGEGFSVGEVKFTALSPAAEMKGQKSISESDTNNCSLVLRMDYKEFSALFTGDIYEAQESKLVKQYGETGELDVDLVKLPHHGTGRTSNSILFANAVTPELAVATGYVVMDPPVYARYAVYGAVKTDTLDGYVHVWTDGTTMQWATSRERQVTLYDPYDALREKN